MNSKQIANTPFTWIRIGRIVSATLLAAGLCLGLHAAPPPSGPVIEGVSVPGVALGSTRSQIAAAYGEPSFCQGPTQGFCTYNISGMGSVNMRYEGPAGGDPLGTSDDVVYNISWSGFTNWITTAGVSTATALADAESVQQAYPAGAVTTNAQGGIYSIRENDLGISVTWNFNPYSGITTVLMSLFEGTGSVTPAPTLTIERAEGETTLRWTGNDGFTLQSCTNVFGEPWATVPETPLFQNGQNSLTVTPAGDRMFFRLAK